MTPQRSTRRSLLRRAGFLGSALAVGSAAPAVAHDEGRGHHRPKGRRPSPVGSWSVTVTIEGVPEVEHAHYSFGSDGQLILQTHRHTHTGIGTWEPTGDGFVYVTRGLRSDADGGLLSELRIRHTARFRPDGGFVSTGTGQALDAGGNVLMEVQSTAVGTRFGVDG
ncbi:hypothetical protein [Streptomyces roseicoloratus]|uniref:Uncharacterized protein n=1 Tax=Streptomyces roseicoloratus TaxID=2508722 RepID=A0ABY9RQT1_9ACTN|nr:hypothetical protein [Streptomyces roseicoloratus]WMX44556.1 hypothetical protein RGF97_06385 [Streptomyces roseicoloratus]